MPYLTDKRKKELTGGRIKRPTTPGDLTYLFTSAVLDDKPNLADRLTAIILKYLPKSEAVRYEHYAIVIGSLVCTGFEYERRIGGAATAQRLRELNEFIQEYYEDVIGPYEDKKIKENGDVYA